MLCAIVEAKAQSYTHFIRQVHQPTGIQWDVDVERSGQRLSPMPLLLGGTRFELWTVRSNPTTSFLLDMKHVDAETPWAHLRIVSEDPYEAIPRTRADRPFWVEYTTGGLVPGFNPLNPLNLVVVYRHVQAYGSGDLILGLDLGGLNFNNDQAIFISAGLVTGNETGVLEYPVTAIPGEDRAKVMGEERFSVFSIGGPNMVASLLDSKFLQVWPVADGSISGIGDEVLIRTAMPDVTLRANDLYPDSTTYAQVYPGEVQDGVDGTVVPGSAVVVNHSVPQQRTMTLENWDLAIPEDGVWTLELLTSTPFGIDRLDYVTFEVDRTIRVNGNLTSLE